MVVRITDRIKSFVHDCKNDADMGKLVRTCFKAVLAAFVICSVMAMVDFDAESQEISQQVLRLHILANSDSEEDQNLKLDVRDCVQQLCYNMYNTAQNKEEAEKIAQESLQRIISVAQNEVNRQGYDYQVHGEIVNMYFENRTYDDITLPAGNYDAVRLTIGEGAGHNWWCVMFPPICVSACENTADISDVLNDEQTDLVTNSGYTYKFKVYELYQNLMEYVNG